MADDPNAAIDKALGSDTASLGFAPRTTHLGAVQILKVEGYGPEAVLPSQGSSLIDLQGRQANMVAAPVSVPARKKTSSFQITSVTMGSRHSNDGGDDSADDLDESHTEDLSSDVLDVSKTTDYDYSSEDAFSSIKDDVATVYQTPGGQGRSNTAASMPALSVFPVAPSGGILNAGAPSNVSVTVVEAPNVPMSVVQNPDIQWQNRFRVVKIQTGEPFRRGRWVCMDFLDPPPPSSAQGDVADKELGTGSGSSSGTSSVQQGESLVLETSTSQNVVTSSWSVEPNAAMMGTGVTNISTGVAGQCEQYPVSILLQTQQQGNLDFTNTALHMQQGRTTQIQSYQPVSTSAQAPVAMQQITTGMIPNLVTSNIPIGAQQSEFSHQTQAPPLLHQTQQPPQASQMPQSTEYAHPSTASLGHVAPVPVGSPAAVQPQTVGGEFRTAAPSMSVAVSEFATTIQTQPPAPLQVEYIHTMAPPLQPPPLTQNDALQPAPQVVPQQVVPPVQQVPPSKEYTATAPQAHVYQPSPAGPLQPAALTVPPLSQGIPANSQNLAVAPSLEQLQQQTQNYVNQQQQMATAATIGMPGAVHPLNNNNAAQDQASQVSQQDGATSGVAQSTVPSSTASEGAAQEGSAVPSGEEGDPESLQALAACLGEGQWPRTKGQLGTSLSVCPTPSTSTYSASGASTVAIDNKIEQAMDLVKSHLMFAVREEVDVLKEKITELLDKINQLEYENTILKANATQETLAKISWPPNPSSA